MGDLKEVIDIWAAPLIDKASLSEIVERHPDLFGFKAVHVSAGINKNDLYFDPVELWAARHNAAHKKVNYEHNDKKVIGHLINSYAADQNLVPIEDDRPEDVRHIITYGVIYGKWNDTDLEKEVHKTIQEIKDGVFKVSMESLSFAFEILSIPMEFANVKDYEGVKNLLDMNIAKIIPREEITDELKNSTKRHGGNGVWNNQRVYIKARDIMFIGQGVVQNPANTESIILDYDNGVILNQSETKELVMEKANDTASEEVATLKASLEALTAEVAKAKAEWDDEKKMWCSEKAAFELFKKDVEKAKAEAMTEVASLGDKFSASEARCVAMATELAAMKDQCEAMMKEKAAWEQEKADKAKTEKMLARAGVLQEKAGLDADTAKDMAAMEMDEASFDKWVAAMTKIKASANTASTDTAASTLETAMGTAPVDTAAAATAGNELPENYSQKIEKIFHELLTK